MLVTARPNCVHCFPMNSGTISCFFISCHFRLAGSKDLNSHWSQSDVIYALQRPSANKKTEAPILFLSTVTFLIESAHEYGADESGSVNFSSTTLVILKGRILNGKK